MSRRIFKEKEPTSLDKLITRVTTEMQKKGPLHDDYPALLADLERLNEVKMKQKRPKFSWDTVILAGGNLLVVVAIAVYERSHVPSSKGFNRFIPLRAPGQSNQT